MIEIRRNGRLTDQIPTLDRGLQYGDGVFETMRVRSHRIALLEGHLQRLRESCARLDLPMPAQATLRREIRRAAARWPEAVIKLIVTRGVGERGYRAPRPCKPTRLLLCEPRAPSTTPTTVRVRLCDTRLSENPALAGLKTLNRLDAVLARSEWRDPRIQEGLMRDHAGLIVCGTMTNVFAAVRGRLITPVLDRCGVNGVMRRWVLQHARGSGVPVAEGRLRMSDLEKADEIFLTNAVVGIWSVRALTLPGKVIHPARHDRAARLRAGFEAFIARRSGAALAR
jgi:4-amino-4-deoxychorismate lyase